VVWGDGFGLSAVNASLVALHEPLEVLGLHSSSSSGK
jgi:hypothetical protein